MSGLIRNPDPAAKLLVCEDCGAAVPTNFATTHRLRCLAARTAAAERALPSAAEETRRFYRVRELRFLLMGETNVQMQPPHDNIERILSEAFRGYDALLEVAKGHLDRLGDEGYSATHCDCDPSVGLAPCLYCETAAAVEEATR